jgi:alanyl-tRNA synthetase
MARQKAEARASWAGSGEAASETIWYGIKERVGASEFLGYDTERAEGVVAALVADGKEVEALAEGAEGAVVLNQTPFYGESGGQVGDTGTLFADGVRFVVTDTHKVAGGLIVHYGKVLQGKLALGQALELDVDHARRSAVRANHSATHLLHEALRQVLGDHVAQKGSLVTDERLRFDFVHPKPLTAEEVAKVEDIANAVVLQNAPVTTRLMALDDARALGARALFDEKYGDEVRVVTMGDKNEGNQAFSIELCGGTHVGRTGDIGVVGVLGESAVAAGVRRLEAVTALGARRHFQEQDKRVRDIASTLKVPVGDIVGRIEGLMDERRRLEKELAEAKRKLAMGGGGAGDGPRDIAGVKFLGKAVSGIEAKDLKGMADEAKASLGSGVVVIANQAADGKGAVVVAVTADLTDRFDAVALVRVASEAMGGKGGGGRKDMAQAGGPDGAKAPAAVEAVVAAMGA